MNMRVRDQMPCGALPAEIDIAASGLVVFERGVWTWVVKRSCGLVVPKKKLKRVCLRLKLHDVIPSTRLSVARRHWQNRLAVYPPGGVSNAAISARRRHYTVSLACLAVAAATVVVAAAGTQPQPQHSHATKRRSRRVAQTDLTHRRPQLGLADISSQRRRRCAIAVSGRVRRTKCDSNSHRCVRVDSYVCPFFSFFETPDSLEIPL